MRWMESVVRALQFLLGMPMKIAELVMVAVILVAIVVYHFAEGRGWL